MWNSRISRRWLVNNKLDKSNMKRTKTLSKINNNKSKPNKQNLTKKLKAKATTTTSTTTTHDDDNICCSVICIKRQIRHTKSRTSAKMKLKHTPRQSRRSRQRQRKQFQLQLNSKSKTSSPCLNQKLEVLLVILLANCCLLQITQAFDMMHSPFSFSSSSLTSSLSFDHNPPRRTPLSRSNLILAPHEEKFSSNDVDVDLVDLQTSSDTLYLHRSQNFKISPKPCSIGSIEGTCMFVWECIKSEGRHVGMCVDSFMFGSCCAHNYTDNIVLPQTFSYTRPTKPIGISSFNHRPRPPHAPHKPSISGMTTIERPHGAGTLVIRPSGPHHQGALHHKPSRPPTSYTTTTTTTTSSRPIITSSSAVDTSSSNSIASNNEADLQAAESISSSSVAPSSNSWPSPPPPANTVVQQHQHHQQHHHHQYWQMTTEPNFITKPRPPSWEKPTVLHPKPAKPTKQKPTATATQQQHHHQHHHQQQQQHNHHHNSPYHHTTLQHLPSLSSSSIVYSTRRPKPTPSPSQISTLTPMKQKPQHLPQLQNNAKPSTLGTTSNQYLRPTTPAWISTSSSSSSTSTSTSTSHRPSSSSSSSPVHTMPTHQYQRPTTLKPATSHWSSATSTSLSTSTSGPATATSASASSTQPLEPLTIESNEILDSQTSNKNDNIPTVRTVSAAKTAECGVPLLTRPETRIVGGKTAAFGRWPWQVSVRRTSFFGFSSTHRCGGALINENWIATAGHCVDDLLTSQIRIRVGEYDFSHVQEQLPYIERGVAAKVVHPKYNFFTYEYDLALVKLEQPLEFAPHVSPICLPQTESLLIGMNATVTGWGRLSEGGTLPSVLQEVSVPIVSNDNCKSMFLRAGRQEFIPDIFLCAGYETGGQDSCQGDSGGPLQVKSQDGRFFLAGIISWGIGCAEANLPGVCTRISKFVPWILEHVT